MTQVEILENIIKTGGDCIGVYDCANCPLNTISKCATDDETLIDATRLLEKLKSQTPKEDNTYWRDVRVNAAIAAMQGVMAKIGGAGDPEFYNEINVRWANSLVKRLREDNNFINKGETNGTN